MLVSSVATLLVLSRDQSDELRTVMAVSWHLDDSKKLAVAYGSSVFQDLASCKHSYVWDIGNHHRRRRHY